MIPDLQLTAGYVFHNISYFAADTDRTWLVAR
jgi:hypothetical protein